VTWPTPEPGLVIRYSYLWAEQAHLGQEEGTKDRPCAIVLAVRRSENDLQVVVLPVTHSPPPDASAALELPASTKMRLGLDAHRSWIVFSEYNQFRWPGPDLRMVPGRGPDSSAYGVLPKSLTEMLIRKFAQRARQGKAARTVRTE
jgi:hypothetical protein